MQLYKNLKELTKLDKGFYSKVEQLETRTYEIFTYDLVSYQSFKLPDALECRGIMFDITDGEPVLVSRTMKKFFNWYEGGIDHSKNKLVYAMPKLDGSLISTYLHNGELRLKSKNSLSSVQCIEAMKLLNSPEYTAMRDTIEWVVKLGNTVNLEYTSPSNQVVLLYPESSLNVLVILNNETGEEVYCNAAQMATMQSVTKDHTAVTDLQGYIQSIKSGFGCEGCVLGLEEPNGEVYQIKVKTDHYCILHRNKEEIQTVEVLIEIVLKGGADDLRSLYLDDKGVLDLIAYVESTAVDIFNNMVIEIKCLYSDNKDLTRKEYAIKMRAEYPLYFDVLIGLYINREVDFLKFALDNTKAIFGGKVVGV